MATTTGLPWQLPYPEATDDVRPYEDDQALAEQVHAKLTGIVAPGWTDYTPVLTASVSNPTLGAGSSIVGDYHMHPSGDLVVCNFLITLATFTAGSGTWFVTAPVTAHTNAVNRSVGSLHILDSGLIDRAGILKWEDASKWSLVIAEKGVTTSAIPQTWAAGDKIRGTFTYRPA